MYFKTPNKFCAKQLQSTLFHTRLRVKFPKRLWKKNKIQNFIDFKMPQAQKTLKRNEMKIPKTQTITFEN